MRLSLRRNENMKSEYRMKSAMMETMEQRILLSVFTVTNTGDNGGVDPAVGAGTGTLRQAIIDSNAATGHANTIDFSIGTGGQAIEPSAALPSITQAVTINGESQPGYAGKPIIVLDGELAGGGTDGLVFKSTTGKSAVKGLDIYLYNGSGIYISGSNTTISGDDIGTDPSGTVSIGNDGDGILIASGGKDNKIGGSSAASRNIISGNSGNGVEIAGTPSGPQTSGNVIEGNYIGTDVTGGVAVANDDSGIMIDSGASDNTVGGTTVGAGNLISGNKIVGVFIEGASSGPQTSGNTVEGNLIGTDIAGTDAIANAEGVSIDDGAADNTIGGLTGAARNIISGNTGTGVYIFDSTSSPPQTTGNIVEGNYIGTDISGTVALANKTGVFLYGGAAGNTIGGTTAAARNVISGNTADGVEIYGQSPGPQTTDNIIEGNYIGTDYTGTVAVANEIGVWILGSASGNTIGGTSVGARNVISGNTANGIEVDGTSTGAQTASNLIEGDYIGVDATGTAALGNYFGIEIEDGAQDNTIGGTTANGRNVISGNTVSGVQIDGTDSGPQTSGNVVEGNYIGTDAAGTSAIGNDFGIEINSGTTDSTIGGTTPGAGNVISGNFVFGVSITGTDTGLETTGNFVLGNYIGTDLTGIAALGNGAGIFFASGAVDNSIGGSVFADANVIAYNTKFGVGVGDAITDSLAVGNDVRLNSIYGNGGLGIDLGSNGITPNSMGGPNSGPNDLQNFPYLSSATSNGANTTVQGLLNSTPNANFVLDYYSNSALDADGTEQGRTYLGSETVITDSAGNAAFTATLNSSVASGQYITATATTLVNLPYGDTSEFAPPVQIVDTSLTGYSVTGLTVKKGTTFSGVVAKFLDGNALDVADDYSITISWGNGNATTDVTPIYNPATGLWSVAGSQKYSKKGTHNITVTIADSGGQSTTVTSSIKVTA